MLFSLILDVYTLGVELMTPDVINAAPATKSVRCSVMRQGSLLVGSCLTLGHRVTQHKLRALLKVVEKICV